MLSNLIKGSINAVYGYTVETISMLVKVISDTPGCMDPGAPSLLQEWTTYSLPEILDASI